MADQPGSGQPGIEIGGPDVIDGSRNSSSSTSVAKSMNRLFRQIVWLVSLISVRAAAI